MALIEQDNGPVGGNARKLGVLGEQLAAEHLRKLGYRLVLSNFTVPIGRNANGATVTGEIDIVALDGDVLCFVEVKTRSSEEFTGPLSAVDLRKQRQIIRAARVYRRAFGLRDVKVRFDAVTVVAVEPSPQIDLVKGFWNEAKFRKRNWSENGFYDD